MDAAHASASRSSTKDVVLDVMAACILWPLEPLFDVLALRKKLVVGEISPTLFVPIQGLDQFNLILREMMTSLREQRRAIAGEVGMSTEVDDVAACLSKGSIPASW